MAEQVDWCLEIKRKTQHLSIVAGNSCIYFVVLLCSAVLLAVKSSRRHTFVETFILNIIFSAFVFYFLCVTVTDGQ